jgi:hypothetical protein
VYFVFLVKIIITVPSKSEIFSAQNGLVWVAKYPDFYADFRSLGTFNKKYNEKIDNP